MKKSALSLFPVFDLQKISRFLWGAVLLTLPVTSFRFFPLLGDSTQVRPLALYPLALLMFLLFIRLWRHEIQNPWPGSVVLLGVFLMAVLLSSALGALNAPLELRGSTYFDRVLRAWMTVVIGLMFFLAAIWMNRNEEDVRFSAKWLLLGLCLHILWSLVQAISFYTPYLPRQTLREWQTSFSMRVPTKNRRFSGLTFEPSWLAGQIATLYIPWLVAALLTRTRVFRIRWVEPVLFLISLILLVFTFSRGGVLFTLVAVVITAWVAGHDLLTRLRDWFVSAFHKSDESSREHAIKLAIRIGLVLVIVALLSGSATMLTRKRYFSKLFSGFAKADTLEEYIVYNYAGGRVAYVWAAMGAYRLDPWTGVGLGASGLYMYDNLPDFSKTTLFEIARQLSPDSRAIPNPKSMFVRILVETGLIGLALFLAFQFSMLADMRALFRSGTPLFFGIVGLFTWITVFLYNVTQDSLATPNLWINLGILMGLARIYSAPAGIVKEIS
jgi:O-Antigen ligase